MKFVAPAIAVGLLLLVLSLGGCPLQGTDTTSLAGTWKASSPEIALPVELLLTFDATNKLTNAHLDPPGTDVQPPVTIQAVVNGSSVSFAFDFPLGLGSLSFDGTLDADKTQVTGTITLKLTVPGVAESNQTGAAVFTKQ
jgi:hypothetical protein